MSIIFDKEQAAAKKDDTEIIVAMCYDSLMNVGNMKIKLSMVTENNVENTSMVFYLPAKKFCFDTLFRTRRNGDIVTIEVGIIQSKLDMWNEYFGDIELVIETTHTITAEGLE